MDPEYKKKESLSEITSLCTLDQLILSGKNGKKKYSSDCNNSGTRGGGGGNPDKQVSRNWLKKLVL